MEGKMDEYLDTFAVAAFLKRTPGAIRNLVLRRKIPFRKVGGRLLFQKGEIKQWVETAPGLRLSDLKDCSKS